ncbi:MAG: hypothetical protein BAJALOKI3v1_130033 [Promethearchaeota archaeon]|nr:MAG: hypothetical protein BAJALOKI3v1_130033 [Candidatus Lokiarchaeota archaeon]
MNKLINTFFEIAGKLDIDAVIIGGLALPAYKIARSTLDIDISISIDTQDKLNEFIENLEEQGIKTLQNPKLNHDLFTIFGKGSEAEIWLKPCDSFNWDSKMTNKTQRFKENINVLAVEDFIITKLARSDRSTVDIDDIVQILIANLNSINWEYLHFRLGWADVKQDFEVLIEELSSEADASYEQVVNKIIRSYKVSKDY